MVLCRPAGLGHTYDLVLKELVALSQQCVPGRSRNRNDRRRQEGSVFVFLQTKTQEEEPLGFGEQVLQPSISSGAVQGQNPETPAGGGLGPDPGGDPWLVQMQGETPRDPQLVVLTAA